jgi:hypothetical protein
MRRGTARQWAGVLAVEGVPAGVPEAGAAPEAAVPFAKVALALPHRFCIPPEKWKKIPSAISEMSAVSRHHSAKSCAWSDFQNWPIYPKPV